jgi:ferredoxin
VGGGAAFDRARSARPAGGWRPVVDHGRCEGKRDCFGVCPYDVFEVRSIDAADYRALWLGRLKSMAHRWQTAYARRRQLPRLWLVCRRCPESAIQLARSYAISRRSGIIIGKTKEAQWQSNRFPTATTRPSYLACRNAASARVLRAFGATEQMRMAAPDGKIGHAEIKISNALIMPPTSIRR